MRTARRLDVDGGRAAGQSHPTVASPPAIAQASGGRAQGSPEGPTNGVIALSGPRSSSRPNQQLGIAVPPIPNPPLAPAAKRRQTRFRGSSRSSRCRRRVRCRAPEPRVIQFPTDATGMVPDHPPIPETERTDQEVAGDVSNLIESVQVPEAEISLVEGQTKIIQTRRELTRIVISNPLVADVELFTDQPSSRLLNLYGKSFGTTSLTMWDQTNRPVSFLVRVIARHRGPDIADSAGVPGGRGQGPPGGPADHSGRPGARLEDDGGHLQLVTITLMSSPSFRTGGGMAMAGGGGGGGGPAGAAGSRATMIINRVTVPGPRQVLLHVKIAEINRTATRNIGVSWLYARGKSIFGSAVGNDATIATTTAAGYTQASGRSGLREARSRHLRRDGHGLAGRQLAALRRVQRGAFLAVHRRLAHQQLAKILAEPNLVALDGQPARFLVGGLFPFPVPQSSSIPGGTAVVTVQFQRFGTILTFLPEILPNDVIRLDVEPVISQLNFAETTTVGTGTVPSITERSARTVVELREGQTLAIAGLLQSLTNASTVRIPGLGDLPIVGPWFSNNTIETIETETVILVTPNWSRPWKKKRSPKRPATVFTSRSDPEFYLLGRIEGKLGREFRATVGQQDPLNLMKHFQSEQQWVIGPHGHAD